MTIFATLAAFLLLASVQAEAVLTLRLSDGSTTVTISDDESADLLLGPGVQFTGSVGNFFLNLTAGFNQGTSQFPYLDLFNWNVSSFGGGTLEVMLTETGFSGSDPFLSVTQIGGTTGGSVSFATYADLNDTPFGLGTPVASLGPYTGAFSGSTLGWIVPDASYSLTLVTTITHPGSTSPVATSFNAELKVAQPATLILLGSAFVGISALGAATRRRVRQR
jgi:hypothetical protein